MGAWLQSVMSAVPHVHVHVIDNQSEIQRGDSRSTGTKPAFEVTRSNSYFTD